MKTPNICRLVIRAPKRAIPTKVVIKGTTELKIEVIPLSRPVCAKANRNGGKKELVSPAMTNHFQSADFIFVKLRKPKMNKVNEANTIRSPPSCRAVKPKSAFFININEDPHMKEIKIK